MKRRNGKLIYAASACATIGGCSIVANYFDDNENVRKTKRMAQSIFRITNLVKTAVHMGTDYAYVLYVDNNSSTSNYSKLQKQLSSLQKDQEINTYNKNNANTIEITDKWQNEIASTRKKIDAITETLANLSDDADSSIMSKVHRRNASRLREMCAQNGGLYIKLGQHLAMLDHIFPTEYQEELSHLLSRNPRSSYESVRRIIKTDIGFFPEELFSEFHTTPLASASLAQVHIAIGKDGKKYAVKVQHEGLLESSPVDRTIITHLVDLIPIFFRDFNYAWLAKEMNLNLPLELDFTNERHNLSECARILSKEIKEGSVAVPVAVPELSSHRVLVMSFEDGVYVSDKEGIKRMGLNPADISRTVSEVFCEQIYRHGFVHCDPHEANILVRKHPWKKGKPQVVLLDHGLYRKLDDQFRRDYTRLWQALIKGDESGIELYCDKLNSGKLHTLLAAMLTMRPWDDIVSADVDKMKLKGTKADTILLQSYAQKYFKEIVHLLGQVPSDMLLLLKTNDCLRHLDRSLGTPINTTQVVAGITADVILKEEMAELAEKSKSDYSKFPLIAWCQQLYDTTRIVSVWLDSQLRVYGLSLIAYSLAIQKLFNYSDDSNK